MLAISSFPDIHPIAVWVLLSALVLHGTYHVLKLLLTKHGGTEGRPWEFSASVRVRAGKPAPSPPASESASPPSQPGRILNIGPEKPSSGVRRRGGR
jgi:hypothetical protein